ncbi:MAG: hypothetical protein ACK53Y_23260, partial [bacterium]
MSIEALIYWNYPRRVSLEQFNHVSLDVPDYDLRLEFATILTIRMSLIHSLSALLELVREWNRWILYLWHATFT